MSKINYGIELEFFVSDDKDQIIPAYEVTNNLDGNPIIGEIRTKIHDNIVDCIFELKKLLFLETEKINKQGYKLLLIPETKVDDTFLKNLRKDKSYINKKDVEILEELSIYSGNTGKMLPKGVYKASVQINFSENSEISYQKYTKVSVEDKYKYDVSTDYAKYSQVFDYVTILRKLDIMFTEEIKNTNRVKGVYAIKNGELGKRIEYRSLPNNIDLDKLLKI